MTVAFHITGAHAIVLADVFRPNVQLFIAHSAAQSEVITLEAAKAVVKAGKGETIYVPCPEGRVVAMIEKLAHFHDAVQSINNAAQQIEERITGERARFIRTSAARNLAALVHFNGVDEHHVEKAVALAEQLDREIWTKYAGAGVEES